MSQWVNEGKAWNGNMKTNGCSTILAIKEIKMKI